MTRKRRKPEVTEEEVCGRMSGLPCKDYLIGTCTNSFCEKWHLTECLFCKSESGCRFGEKCSCAHCQVDEQPIKRSKKNGDQSAVAMLKKNDWHESVRQPVENAYSYEWINGQKSQLIQNGFRILCNTENFVLIVVLGLSSSSSGSSSASETHMKQESHSSSSSHPHLLHLQ